jgi:FkbM family methyltransferase
MQAVAFGRRVVIQFPVGADHIKKQMQKRGWYEKDMLLDIYKHVRAGGLALDVGAYCGTHTLWLARICNLRVIAFEPAPLPFQSLQFNVRKNGLSKHVQLVNAAVGARSGQCRLIDGDPENTGTTKAEPDDGGTVPMVALDQYSLSDVRVLKIDVEGGELEVLRGAAETIRRCRPRIYIETLAIAEVEQVLAGLGYERVGVYNATPTYCFAPLPLPVKLSTAIMAHPTRERHIPYLQQKMGGGIAVVWDQVNNRWDTGRRAMLAFDPAATHHLVVQDDALLCEDFLPGVREALRYTPDNPVALYAGAVRPRSVEVEQRVRMAKGQRLSWFQMEGPWWGVAVAVPTKFIPDMIRHCDKLAAIANYDMRMARYFGSIKVKCYYTIPSLVNHRIGKDEPSLVPGRGNLSGRVAKYFIGESTSALTIDWSKI